MCIHMDKLLENAQTYSDILKRCGSSEVSNWKAEDLERAFHWAEYFRKVHGRVTQKHSLVQRFDGQLKEVGRQLCMRFGREEFSYGFLAHSSGYLVKALLENPALPGNLREKILKDHASDPVHKQHVEDFTTTSTLLETLSSIHTRLVESQTSTKSELCIIDAKCLQEDISWLLKDSSSQRLTDSIQKRLSSLVQQENGLEIILLALTLSENAGGGLPPSSQSCGQSQVQGAILKWLLHQLATPGLSISGCKMWELDCKLLAGVSKSHLEFFKVHIQYLVQEMDKFALFSTGQFKDNTQSQEQKFEEIVSHFRELMSHAGCVREVCTSLIESRMPEKEKFVIGMDLQDVWSRLHLRLNQAPPTNTP